MGLPTLSVIIPNYNHAKCLPNCLQAILSQSLPPTEVIVVDDASKDESMDVLADFARRFPSIRVHRNEQNQGVSYTVNRGMDLARGDFLFFPGADDEVKPGIFEKSMRLLGTYPNAALCCTATEWRDASSGLRWHMAADMASHPCFFSPSETVDLGRRGKLLIVSSSAIFRKDPLVEAGKFLPDLKWHSDWYATYITAFRYGFCYVPESLSDFFLHSTSYYHRGRKSQEHTEVLKHLLDKLVLPECADVAPRVRDSGALALFELPLLSLMLREKRYRQFLTPLLVFRCFKRNAEVNGRKWLPKPIARLILRTLYSSATNGLHREPN